MSVQDRVLRILEENRGRSISGSAIAEKLGVTRAAVWKAVEQLRGSGIRITAGTNRGYCIEQGSDILTAQRVQVCLDALYAQADCTAPVQRLGSQIIIEQQVDSTNNVAKRLAADGAVHGLCIAAHEQSGGRGRLGRQFYSPDSGVYMSVVLRPHLPAEQAALLTSAAAVAVCRAIEAYISEPAKIKWVNDIYIGGKKVCGILSEAVSDFEGGGIEFAVVGIGINIAFDDQLPHELKEIVTCLTEHGAAHVERAALIARVLFELEKVYPQLEEATFMEEYRRRCFVIGRDAYALRGGQRMKIHITGVDDTGALLAVDDTGRQVRLSSGEISIRPL